jgi:hypothetical protein
VVDLDAALMQQVLGVPERKRESDTDHLSSEHRTEAMPPKLHRLVADLDATLVQQVLDVPEREREADAQYDRQADDLGRRLEVLEGAGFGHVGTLLGALPRLKLGLSDRGRG